MNRPVTVFKYWRPEGAKYDEPYKKVEVGTGTFLQFGVDFHEFDTGGSTFTTPVVEMTDGTVLNVAVDMIQFMDK